MSSVAAQFMFLITGLLLTVVGVAFGTFAIQSEPESIADIHQSMIHMGIGMGLVPTGILGIGMSIVVGMIDRRNSMPS